ncbi:NAD(P)/FAD-dependent oxidoreductase [Haliea sp.]
MTSYQKIAIVGAGVAGVTAAASLRQEGYKGDITLLSNQRDYPYDLPPLSKTVISSGTSVEQIMLQPSEFYRSNNVNLLLDWEVAEIDPIALQLRARSGERISADAIIIATGGRPIEPSIEVRNGASYYRLKSYSDAIKLRQMAKSSNTGLIVGAGLIGCEVAASLRQCGCDVTLVDASKAPMERVFPAHIRKHLTSRHQAEGVQFKFEKRLLGLDFSTACFEDGTNIEADFILMAVGSRPNIELAESSGIEVFNGVSVNDSFQTNYQNVYCIGDTANIQGVGRQEHWTSAQAQGMAVAHSILTGQRYVPRTSWVWSDQYDLRVEAAGNLGEVEQFHTRSGESTLIEFGTKQGQVVFASGISSTKEMRLFHRIIEADLVLDTAELTDASRNIRELIKENKVV